MKNSQHLKKSKKKLDGSFLHHTMSHWISVRSNLLCLH